MKQKIKILFPDLTYLNYNYGAQGIAFSLIEELDKYFDAEYTFVVSKEYYQDDCSFLKKYGFNIIISPNSYLISVALERGWFVSRILYSLVRLFKKKIPKITENERELFSILVRKLQENDVVIDLSGIEFTGGKGIKSRWLGYMQRVWIQRLTEKHNKLYLKYTKSYGPFPDRIYRYFVGRRLNKLPFVFVRGKNNLKIIKRLNLKPPIYSFPDISIALKPENKDWAIRYIKNLGLVPSESIIGISPSAVISSIPVYSNNSSCSVNHIKLCKEIIKFFQSKGSKILLIPHSLDKKHPESCDLALTKKIYNEIEDKTNVFIISEGLTYKQVRSIVGLLDFYITGRYHSVSSALSMGIPVISLAWHIKYRDIMSLFLDDFLVIDCRTTSIRESLALIKKYYDNQNWFNRDKVLKRKEEAMKQINKSIEILTREIEKSIQNKKS